VAQECVSWLETAFGSVIDVTPIDQAVNHLRLEYRITYKPENGVGPTVLVGWSNYLKDIGIMAYPAWHVNLRYIDASVDSEPELPPGCEFWFAGLDQTQVLPGG